MNLARARKAEDALTHHLRVPHLTTYPSVLKSRCTQRHENVLSAALLISPKVGPSYISIN